MEDEEIRDSEVALRNGALPRRPALVHAHVLWTGGSGKPGPPFDRHVLGLEPVRYDTTRMRDWKIEHGQISSSRAMPTEWSGSVLSNFSCL